MERVLKKLLNLLSRFLHIPWIWRVLNVSGCELNSRKELSSFVSERAAKIVDQQERERPPQKQASPRAGTPVGAMMGMVPSPSTMGMINQTMTPVSGNPSLRGSTSV